MRAIPLRQWARRHVTLGRRYAGRGEHLVPVEKQVSRGGKSHAQIYWVAPKVAERMKSEGKVTDPSPDAMATAGRDSAGKPAIPTGRKWVAKLDHLPDETWQKHFDKHPKEGGKPSPERQKLYDDIKKECMDSVATVPADQRPQAILMMGGPASGKSSMARGLDESRFVKVDPDGIKAKLPEYQDAIDAEDKRGTSAQNAAAMAHEESSYLARQIGSDAIAGRKNVLYDGTGGNSAVYGGLIDRLKAQGYKVTILAADLEDTDAAWLRSVSRAEQEGRWVPENVLRETHAKVPKSFIKLARAADNTILYDTTDRSPRKVWSKAGEEETVYDADYWERYQARGK